MRPRDDEDNDARSDDLVSDEELEVSRNILKEALQTRVGGQRATQKEREEEGIKDSEVIHATNDGMELAGAVWGESLREQSNVLLTEELYGGEVEKILKEAKASQRKEASLAARMAEAEERDGEVKLYKGATTRDVETWPSQVPKKCRWQQVF